MKVRSRRVVKSEGGVYLRQMGHVLLMHIFAVPGAQADPVADSVADSVTGY